jgi:hypothetical protein
MISIACYEYGHAVEGCMKQEFPFYTSDFEKLLIHGMTARLEQICLMPGKNTIPIYDKPITEFKQLVEQSKKDFNRLFFDTKQGRYKDGADTGHSSLHANMFPMAFGLVLGKKPGGVLDYMHSRGMACSISGALILMEALYNSNLRTQLVQHHPHRRNAYPRSLGQQLQTQSGLESVGRLVARKHYSAQTDGRRVPGSRFPKDPHQTATCHASSCRDKNTFDLRRYLCIV